MSILKLFLIFVVFALTFFFIPSSGQGLLANVYEPRLYLIPAFAVVAALAYFASVSSGKSIVAVIRQSRPQALSVLISAYVLLVMLSAFLSPLPGYAWLGYSSLQFGVVLLLGSWLLLYVYSKVEVGRRMIVTLALCSLVMALFTVAEALGYRPLDTWIFSKVMSYPAAFVGHRPHLGGWFSIMSLAPLYFYRARQLDRVFWVWLAANIVGLALSTTTAATVGVLAGLLIFSFTRSGNFSTRMKIGTLLAFVFAALTLPPASQAVGRSLGLPGAQLKDYASTGSFKPRLFLWKSAFKAGLERPLYGWGDETFAFQAFEHLSPKDARNLFRAELGLSQKYDVTYKGFTYIVVNRSGKTDKEREGKLGSMLYIRAHDILLDEIYAHGFVAFFLLVAIVVLSLRRLKAESSFDFWFFLAAAVPYFVYLLAWFYVPTVAPLYFILLGVMTADYSFSRKVSLEQDSRFHAH